MDKKQIKFKKMTIAERIIINKINNMSAIIDGLNTYLSKTSNEQFEKDLLELNKWNKKYESIYSNKWRVR